MMQKTNTSESELFIKLELAIKDWHNENNDWPYGENVIIDIYPDWDEIFSGPSIDYKCDSNRKRLRNLMIHGFWSDLGYINVESFVSEMKKICGGLNIKKNEKTTPKVKYLAEIISKIY